MRRLQAADPAAEQVRATVRARLAAAGGATGPRGWLVPVVAGVCAAALAAPAGFAAATLHRVDGPPRTALAPLETMPVIGEPDRRGGQSVDAAPSAARSDGMFYPDHSVTLVAAAGLPDDRTIADGYRLTSDGLDLFAVARDVAGAFSLPGEPTGQGDSVTAGAVDGSGPSVWLYKDTTSVSWSYTDPAADPWGCPGSIDGTEPAPVPEPAPQKSQPEPDAGVGSGTTGAVGSFENPSPAQAAPGVSPGRPDGCSPARPLDVDRAQDAALDLLGKLGVDRSSVSVETGSDEFTTWVHASLVVAGYVTPMAWQFTFDDRSVVWASGFAATLETLPGYPVVGARTAVERVSMRKFAAFGPTPVDSPWDTPDALDPAGTVTGSPQDSGIPEPTTGHAERSSGGPPAVQVWFDPVEVTAAQLSLAQYWQPDGSVLFLPAYRLSTSGDPAGPPRQRPLAWMVIAVDEAAVEFVQPR